MHCVLQWYQDLVKQVNADAYASRRVIWDVLNEPDCKVTHPQPAPLSSWSHLPAFLFGHWHVQSLAYDDFVALATALHDLYLRVCQPTTYCSP